MFGAFRRKLPRFPVVLGAISGDVVCSGTGGDGSCPCRRPSMIRPMGSRPVSAFVLDGVDWDAGLALKMLWDCVAVLSCCVGVVVSVVVAAALCKGTPACDGNPSVDAPIEGTPASCIHELLELDMFVG